MFYLQGNMFWLRPLRSFSSGGSFLRLADDLSTSSRVGASAGSDDNVSDFCQFKLGKA